MKIAFCFPGQGSLAQGMGKDIAESVPEAMEVYDRGSEARANRAPDYPDHVHQRVQQDHRIGTARDCDEHGMAAFEHLIVLDGLLHLLKKRVHSRSVQGERVG